MNTVKKQFELTKEMTEIFGLLPEQLYLTKVTNVWVTAEGDVFSMRNGSLRKLKQAKRHMYDFVNVGKNYTTHKLMESAGLIDTAVMYDKYNDTNIHHIEKVTEECCNNHVSNLTRIPEKYHPLYDKVQDVILIDDVCEHTDVIGALTAMRLSIKAFKWILRRCESYMLAEDYSFYYVTNGKRKLHFAVKYH